MRLWRKRCLVSQYQLVISKHLRVRKRWVVSIFIFDLIWRLTPWSLSSNIVQSDRLIYGSLLLGESIDVLQHDDWGTIYGKSRVKERHLYFKIFVYWRSSLAFKCSGKMFSTASFSRENKQWSMTNRFLGITRKDTDRNWALLQEV